MFKRILLPNDGSPVSQKAVRQGIAFAKAVGAKVVGFYCAEDYRALIYTEYVPPALLSEAEFEAQSKKVAEKRLALVEKTAKAAGVPFEGFYLISTAPWEAIIEASKKKKCDLIFMGSHGHKGLAGLLLGSQTNKVLTHSKVPVLVYR